MEQPKKRGRPMLGDQKMTVSERQAAHRQKKREKLKLAQAILDDCITDADELMAEKLQVLADILKTVKV